MRSGGIGKDGVMAKNISESADSEEDPSGFPASRKGEVQGVSSLRNEETCTS